MSSRFFPFALLLVLCSSSVAAAAGGAELLARIDIDAIGPERIEAIRSSRLTWWVELDDVLLVLASSATLDQLGSVFAVDILPQDPVAGPLSFVRGGHAEELEELGFPVLAAGGRWVVVQAPGMTVKQLEELSTLRGDRPLRHGEALTFEPFEPSAVLARQASNMRVSADRSSKVNAQPLLDEIDADRWFADLNTLAGWNRNTHSSEIDDAQAFLETTFGNLGLTVTSPGFSVQGTSAFNVIGTLVGTARPDDWYVVGAHYDSTSENTNSAAPGAEDNASGCAAVIEMARVFSLHPPESTILFMCYSGEEQGLIGSEDHVGDLQVSGDAAKLKVALIMDMIGYDGDSTLDCLLESSASFQLLINDLASAAAAHTTLVISTSTFPFGSDHMPYINAGIPSILAIENDWDIYPHYHRTTDLPGQITLEMGYQIIRMNVAALAEMAGIDTSAIDLFRDDFESAGTTSWSASKPD